VTVARSLLFGGGGMYYFETEDIRLEIGFERYDRKDHAAGNPYNTVLSVSARVRGFGGTSEWTVDFDEWKAFVRALKTLYDVLNGETELRDREYGSVLRVECDGTGHFAFSGKLIDGHGQKLEFHFTVDQTVVKDFAETLYSDFGK
jgi:hypothetical protein